MSPERLSDTSAGGIAARVGGGLGLLVGWTALVVHAVSARRGSGD